MRSAQLGGALRPIGTVRAPFVTPGPRSPATATAYVARGSSIDSCTSKITASINVGAGAPPPGSGHLGDALRPVGRIRGEAVRVRAPFVTTLGRRGPPNWTSPRGS